jgi:hypothetical protein
LNNKTIINNLFIAYANLISNVRSRRDTKLIN